MANNVPITNLGDQPPAISREVRDYDAQQAAIFRREDKLAKRNEERKYGKPTVQVTINAPHTAQVRGSHIALKIDTGTTDGDQTTDTLDDIIVVLNGTAYYTDLQTDGRLDAV